MTDDPRLWTEASLIISALLNAGASLERIQALVQNTRERAAQELERGGYTEAAHIVRNGV